MKYQNVKLRQAAVVYFMTLHYWAMKQSFPISSGFWVFGLHHWVGLQGLTMMNKQIGQCGALYRVIVLIVEPFITFLPRSKHLLISWLQSPSAVILEPQKRKSDTVSPSISHEVMGPDAMIFVF